jgi:hypothetical protein
MAEIAVARQGASVALACRTFGVSETCYRYASKLQGENEEIADLLIGLTQSRRNWGFGLCFLYLRNVKSHPWNHKRVYRIYRALELNLRIKPRRRLQRDKPDTLAVPEAPNLVWSMDFMADRLGDGRTFRLLNLLDDFNREGLGHRLINRIQIRADASLTRARKLASCFSKRVAIALICLSLLKNRSKKWLAKFEHSDKWNFCLNSAMMPWNRRDDDAAYPP